MHKIPAMARLLDDPNVKKLVACPCWSKGWVQCKIPIY